MEKRGINTVFFGIIILHIAVSFLLIFSGGQITLTIVQNFLFSELLIIIPGVIYLLFYWKRKQRSAKDACEEEIPSFCDRLGFHKIKVSTFFMTILFTFMIMPLTTLINAISMLFVDNTMLEISPQMLEMPFFVMLFLVAIYGPFCEEFIFRGIVYQGYKRQGTTFAAVILSAVLFGLMHLNFNQAGYAFAMGIALALLMEASGSIWTAILCHFIFNAQSVCLLYIEDRFMPQMLETQMQAQIPREQMYLIISVYFVIAAITTAVACCILGWIAKNEGRTENFSRVLPGRQKKKSSLFSPILVAGIIISVGYMLFEAILSAAVG